MTRKGLQIRELLLEVSFQIKFNPEFQKGDWKDEEQVMQIQKLLKDLFTWSMDNRMFSMAASWVEVGITTQNICLKQIPWMDLMDEIKGWNPNKNLKLLEERETRIRENQEAIKSIENSWHMIEPNQIQVPQDREE
ncbi:hypothetical protein O181_002987 [Austropuccinia psidii MF-1]|uniref:Uncharacterized protein n=1 Tax=Austropuccinia psidii MF-1 TaxID=1389203 RepID=A0A9Q3GEH1_9BASI|nr:hypothetical protein [Austropuccinia psidii MF-1]